MRGVNKYRLSLKSKGKKETSNYSFYKRKQKGKHSGFTYGLEGLYFRVGISNLWGDKELQNSREAAPWSIQNSAAPRRVSRPGQGDSQTPTLPGEEVWQGGLASSPGCTLLPYISSCPGLEYLFLLGSWQAPTQGSKSCSEVRFQG